VFHTAALVDYWSRFAFQRSLSYSVNVTGVEVRTSARALWSHTHTLTHTFFCGQNMLAACTDEGVKQFIYTRYNLWKNN
jgi:hypothetical protein